MKNIVLATIAVLVSTTAFAQPAIEVGPGGVRIDPGGRRFEPREERVVREEGGCRIVTVRRFDEYGRRTSRRIRECDEDDDE